MDQDKLKNGIDDRLKEAENMLRSSLGMNIPDGYLGEGRGKSSLGSLYTFYINREALSEAGYESAWEAGSVFDLINAFNTMGQDNYLLDGFQAVPLSAFAGQQIFDDKMGAESTETDTGVYLTEAGILGFNIIYDRSYGEMLTEDVPVLNYENAEKAFEKAVTENLDTTKCEVNQMKFNYVKMTYYAIPSPDNPAESTLIPAWMFRDENTYTVILMNAMDGSLIDIIY